MTDTDVAFPLKAKVRQRQRHLRKELAKLAQHEETRAVFRCGTYEVLRVLAESLEELQEDFQLHGTLRKACVRNGWTVLRPMHRGKKHFCHPGQRDKLIRGVSDNLQCDADGDDDGDADDDDDDGQHGHLELDVTSFRPAQAQALSEEVRAGFRRGLVQGP